MTGSAGLRPIGEIAAEVVDRAVTRAEIIARFEALEAEGQSTPRGPDRDAIAEQVAKEAGVGVGEVNAIMVANWFPGLGVVGG